ncbi:hypothetical protein F4680DRAFT_445234 [Xylaria scruposa]|nr:hypothetical protein F4680DRAFT_445234 [Xylaria scruposa]
MADKKGSHVPTERIFVARFGRKVIRYTEEPDAKGWIVKTTTDPHKPFSLWLLPEELDSVRQIYPEIPEIEKHGAFIWGYPLRDLAIPIPTCGTSQNRPKTLWRLTHEGQPHGGMKPRGYGLVKVDPFSFQMFAHKHLYWRCRNLSPFISVTNSTKKIDRIYRVLLDWGCQDIKLTKFRAYGRGWDHKKQRLYHVPTLERILPISRPQAFTDYEYLLEGEIPRESIIRQWSLPSDGPPRQSRKRKPPTETPTESDVQDNNKEKTKRATAFKSRL